MSNHDDNRIPVDWTKHLKDKEAKEKFEQLLKNSGKSLGRLRTIIHDKQETLSRSERDPKVYDVANWAYMQAHNNGFLQGLQFIDRLLSFIEKD